MEKYRKNRSLIIIPFGIVLALSFFSFSFKISKAETIVFENLIQSTSTYRVLNSFQNLGQPTTNGILINNVNLILKNENQANNSISRISISACSVAWSSTDGTCSGTNFGSITSNNFSTTIGEFTNFNSATYTFSTGTTTNTSRFYKLDWTPVSFADNFKALGSANANSFTNGNYRVFVGASYQDDEAVKDIYFKIGSNLSTSLTGNYIDIVFPHNNEALPDFGNWGLQYNFSTTTPNDIWYGVRYGTSSQLTSEILNASYVNIASLQVQGYASTTLPKTASPPIGDYYAQGFIRYNPSGCQNTICQPGYYIATSTVIQFSLITQGDPNNPAFLEGTNIVVLQGNNCDDLVFNIFSGIVWEDFINCLFIPSASSTSVITSSLNGFTGFFPFNLFFNFQKTITEYLETNSSSTQKTLTLNIPYGNQTFSATIFGNNDFESTFGNATKELWFEIQENFIWALTGLGIVLLVL